MAEAAAVAVTPEPPYLLHALLFTDVTNMEDVCARLKDIAPELGASLMRADLVPSLTPLHLAAHRAGHCHSSGSMKASSLAAELVSCLHAGRNVGEALRALSPTPATRDVLACICTPAHDESQRAAAQQALQQLCGVIRGTLIRSEDVPAYLRGHADMASLRRIYDLTDAELGMHAMTCDMIAPCDCAFAAMVDSISFRVGAAEAVHG